MGKFEGANEFLQKINANKRKAEEKLSSSTNKVLKSTIANDSLLGTLEEANNLGRTSILNSMAYSVDSASKSLVSKIKSVLNINSKKVGYHNELPWNKQLDVDWSPTNLLKLDSSYFHSAKEMFKNLPKEHGAKIYSKEEPKVASNFDVNYKLNVFLQWQEDNDISNAIPSYIQLTENDSASIANHNIVKNNNISYTKKDDFASKAIAGVTGGLINGVNQSWTRGLNPDTTINFEIKEIYHKPIKAKERIDFAKGINGGYFNFRITNDSNNTYEIFPAYIKSLNEGTNVSWSQIDVFNKSEPEYAYVNSIRNFSMDFVLFANTGGTRPVPQRDENARLWESTTTADEDNTNHKPVIRWMKYSPPDDSDVSKFGYKFYRNFEDGYDSTILTVDDMYRKINFIHSCCYPNYAGNRLESFPFCKLLLGNLYTDIKFIIDSVNINYTPLMWSIHDGETPIVPIIAEISISGKFIHRRLPNSEYIFY